MSDSGISCRRSFRLSKLSWALGIVLVALAPLGAQSNRSVLLLGGGEWHLHARIPLGSDTLLLQPARRVVSVFATAEASEFEGWSLTAKRQQPVLLDAAGKPVHELPKSITFRVTAGTREKVTDAEAAPLECSKDLNDFLLDLHFTVQVFRGMEMRELRPTRAWMIGIPADEPSEERIYRASFDFGDLRPDDRIALLVTDSKGVRLAKFHLEFL